MKHDKAKTGVLKPAPQITKPSEYFTELRVGLHRCEWINPTIFPSLAALVDVGRSIGPVAVREVLEFVEKKTSSEWTDAQKEKMKQKLLFDERHPLEEIPFDFYFRWKDGDGIEHKSPKIIHGVWCLQSTEGGW